MSAAVDILNELSRRGVAVRVDGKSIKLKPRAPLDDGLLARVRAHKPEIMAVLSVRPVTCSPTCYEIEPGKRIHHPWAGCRTSVTPRAEKPPRKVESTCWHCNGTRECGCSTCWRPTVQGKRDCVVCNGTGTVWRWMQ
jgi:hypothetical protein